jgi:3-phenylpropionate/trans-cinnamate dioxygenase ferredoxin component
VIDVAGIADLVEGEPMLVQAGETPVCLVNVAGTVHAIHDICSHAMESLSGGWVDGDTIECPRHGASFSLVTGEALGPPATTPVPTFAVEVRDGRVLLDPTPSRQHPLFR